MRESVFRPRLDVLEDRVPPSDALFSLLLPPLAVLQTGGDASITMFDHDDQISQNQDLHPRFLPEAAKAALEMTSAAPTVTLPTVTDSGLTLEIVQSLGGGGPTIQALTVSLGVLPDSTLGTPTQTLRFGSDPPTASLGVDIDEETGDVLLPAERMNLSFDINLPFGLGRINLSSVGVGDGTGTYDFSTGAAAISAALYFHATSQELKGFDNENCKLGNENAPLAVMLSTGLKGGVPFSGGDGTMVANDFDVPALATGSCGSGPFGDWAELGNFILGTPYSAGEVVLLLNLRQDPPLGP